MKTADYMKKNVAAGAVIDGRLSTIAMGRRRLGTMQTGVEINGDDGTNMPPAWFQDNADPSKLTEQRKFVLWWDGQEKQAGARTPRAGRPASPLLSSFGIEHHTISRWRRRLKAPDKFAEALEAAHERCVKVCEARQGLRIVAQGTPEDVARVAESYTGQYLAPHLTAKLPAKKRA